MHLEDIMVKFTPLGHQDILKDQNVLINDPLEKEVLSAIEESSKWIIERIGSRKSGQWIVK